MKKVSAALLGITIVISVLTGGAFSYMTADAENLDNTIHTGAMGLSTDPRPFMSLSGIAPGGPAQEATVSVYSTTPTKFYYKVSVVRQTGTSTKLWNEALFEIKDSVTGEAWSGHLNGLATGWFARADGVEGGGASAGRIVNFKVWVPQQADVDPETTATIKFKFDAEQWRPVTG